MTHVLVVDNGEVGRLGRAAALEVAGHRPTAMGWEEAARLVDEPGSTQFDLVLAALRPDPSSWDRYGSLTTAGKLARNLPGQPEMVALVWGDGVDNPLLGVRMARAGISRAVPSTDAGSSDDLHAIVTDATVGVRPTPTSQQLACVGVGVETDPDAVIAWNQDRMDHPEHGPAYRNAFEPMFAQNTCGLSRRQAYALRVGLTKAGRILTPVGRSGGGPVSDVSLPRWSEVISVANLCRGVDVMSRSADAVDAVPVPRRFVA